MQLRIALLASTRRELVREKPIKGISIYSGMADFLVGETEIYNKADIEALLFELIDAQLRALQFAWSSLV